MSKLLLDQKAEIASMIADESFKLALASSMGIVPVDAFIGKVLERLIYMSVLYTFHEVDKDKSLSDIDKFNLATKQYGNLKYIVQNSVADAFSRGLEKFSGQKTDYYCHIKPTPAAVNKEPI